MGDEREAKFSVVGGGWEGIVTLCAAGAVGTVTPTARPASVRACG